MKKNEAQSNILIVGVGGQGTILASDILSRAALLEGKDVKKSEIHGMSQRGGSVFSHIRFAEKVFSPIVSYGECDILLSLEKMETLRWLPYLSTDTKVIVLDKEIMPASIETYPKDILNHLDEFKIKPLIINESNLLNKIKNRKMLNVALLGRISNFLDIKKENWEKAITASVPKGSESDNLNAFLAGKTYN